MPGKIHGARRHHAADDGLTADWRRHSSRLEAGMHGVGAARSRDTGAITEYSAGQSRPQRAAVSHRGDSCGETGPARRTVAVR